MVGVVVAVCGCGRRWCLVSSGVVVVWVVEVTVFLVVIGGGGRCRGGCGGDGVAV